MVTLFSRAPTSILLEPGAPSWAQRFALRLASTFKLINPQAPVATGGVVTAPAVSHGFWVRNGAAGDVSITAGGAISALFATGDAGPCFGDGSNTYGIRLGGKALRTFITDANQAVIDYVNLAISQG